MTFLIGFSELQTGWQVKYGCSSINCLAVGRVCGL
jgi:hypothetical protein